MVQVGFCLEMVYDTYLVLWKSRQKCKRTGDGENFYCVMKFQTDFKTGQTGFGLWITCG
jgi:hypothetical protein